MANSLRQSLSCSMCSSVISLAAIAWHAARKENRKIVTACFYRAGSQLAGCTDAVIDPFGQDGRCVDLDRLLHPLHLVLLSFEMVCRCNVL